MAREGPQGLEGKIGLRWQGFLLLLGPMMVHGHSNFVLKLQPARKSEVSLHEGQKPDICVLTIGLIKIRCL